MIIFEPATLVNQRLKRQSKAQKTWTRLVSNEKFSEILWASGWALGQATWAKMAQKLLHWWCYSQKIRNSQPKKFFRVQSKRLSDPFEPLNSSLAQSAGELGRW